VTKYFNQRAHVAAQRIEIPNYICVVEFHYASISGTEQLIFSKKVTIIVGECTLYSTFWGRPTGKWGVDSGYVHFQTRVRRFRFYIFFASKRKKIPYFSLSFTSRENDWRTLGVLVSLLYFFRFKAKKNPLFFA
jgi:hypothetical protein